MRRTVHGLRIECISGDISAQESFTAVVNAANAALRPGGGVAGALHRAAGPGLEEECRPLAPISPGQAVLTGAHHLPNRYVIHCLGPVYGRDRQADELLAACYRNALQLAERHAIDSVAFPSISTGAFGFPLRPAAAIALGTVAGMASRLDVVERVRFVLFGPEALEEHERVLAQIAKG
ncbi:MAG: macro domain-containing protein [Gemmatimonadota bacterium]